MSPVNNQEVQPGQSGSVVLSGRARSVGYVFMTTSILLSVVSFLALRHCGVFNGMETMTPQQKREFVCVLAWLHGASHVIELPALLLAVFATQQCQAFHSFILSKIWLGGSWYERLFASRFMRWWMRIVGVMGLIIYPFAVRDYLLLLRSLAGSWSVD